MGQSYDAVSDFAALAVDAVTPVRAFSTNKAGRHGVRIKNPLSVIAYVREVPVALQGTTDPTFAGMVTSRINDAELNPGDVYESGARENVNIWLCIASGTGSLQVKEIS